MDLKVENRYDKYTNKRNRPIENKITNKAKKT